MKTTLIARIARLIQAHEHCLKSEDKVCEFHINELAKLQSLLPNGSGIDEGCKIVIEKSSFNKVVISFGFHHMNEGGYYDGWTNHELIVKPEFDGISLRITGKNRNQIKDYLYDLFDYTLTQTIEI